MKAKTITLSIALAVVLSTLLSAQQTVHFEYDGAGNRILRYITVKKLTEADTLLFEPALPLHALLDKPTEDLAGEAHIHVYPNPTYGLLNVEATGQQQGPLAWYLSTSKANCCSKASCRKLRLQSAWKHSRRAPISCFCPLPTIGHVLKSSNISLPADKQNAD